MPRRKRRGAGSAPANGRRRGRRRGRRPGMSAGSLPALDSLHAIHSELLAQRAALDRQINAVEHAVSTLGGARLARRSGRPSGPRPATRRGRGGRRGPRAGSLKEYIATALSRGGVMSVKDITDAVVKGGYKTRNKTLAKSVGIALTEIPGVQKVARGQFKMK